MKIQYKRGKCSGECGREDVLIVQKSLKLCAFCNQKRLTKRYNQKRRTKEKVGEKAKVPESYYKRIWDESEKVCFETGEPLYTYRNWHVHHVLHKEDYPQFALNDDVCVLLALDVHAGWHSIAPSDRRLRYPKTYKRYIEMCLAYQIEPEF